MSDASSRPRTGVIATAIAAVALVFPATAVAERVIAGPLPTAFLNPEVAIDRGEALTFFNADATAPHDVTSTDIGPGATALFRSETVGFGIEVPVVGADSLAPGSYPFICSIHSFMEGTLTVSGSGGDEGGDSKAPELSVRALDRRIDDVLERGALKSRVKLDEPATVKILVTAGRGEVKIASTRKKLESGASRIAAKLSSGGKRVLARADRIRLELTAKATDAAGNARKRGAEATLR